VARSPTYRKHAHQDCLTNARSGVSAGWGNPKFMVADNQEVERVARAKPFRSFLRPPAEVSSFQRLGYSSEELYNLFNAIFAPHCLLQLFSIPLIKAPIYLDKKEVVSRINGC
jgi:hypothetical protein